MAATTKTWLNNNPPTEEDVDLNGFKNENNNLIVGSGQVLDTGDNQQTHKAVAHYAAGGDYYVDSGVANAYVLGTTGSQIAPPVYFSGMSIRFVAGNINTGASTVNVAGLGVKSIIADFDGSAFVGGEVTLGLNEAYYDGTSFRMMRIESRDQLSFTPTVYGSTGGTAPTGNFLGEYSVLGRVVTFSIHVDITNAGSPTGILNIGNLPYNIGNSHNIEFFVGGFNKIALGVSDILINATGFTTGDFIQFSYDKTNTGGSRSSISASLLVVGSIIDLSGTYWRE